MRKVPNWDQYFLSIAEVVASRSKDPNTQVGAVLINEDKHIIGTGYNGFSPKTRETEEMWQRPQKYEKVIHAELNCLLHKTQSAKNSTLYITMSPCDECCKAIVAAGVKRVVYVDPKYISIQGAEFLLESDVELIQHNKD